MGSVFGKSLELVYPFNTMGEFLSELTWEMAPVIYTNLRIDFGRKNLMSAMGFFASASIKLGIPGNSGTHENRDWMSTQNNGLTHFSSHTNMMKDFLWADIRIGFSIPIRNWFYITPSISGSWMRFSFSGRDGYGKYARYSGCTAGCPPGTPSSTNPHPPGCAYTSDSSYYPIDSNPFNYVFTGEVIRYKQDWLLAAAGFTIGTNIFSPLLLEFSFQISPFTYCAAVDDHLLRALTFNDYTAWGLFIEPKGSVSFITERIVYSLEFSYRYIGDTKGNTVISDGSGYYKAASEAGAGLSIIDINFTVRLRI